MQAYLKFGKGLFLVQQEIKDQGQAPAPAGVNHILMYDRSGSMYGALPQLVKDLKERLQTVPVGDTISLGWFSGRNEWNFVLKGFKITGPKDYKTLADILDKNDSTIGMTCFSEILTECKQVVTDLKPLGNVFALTFLTDGYPTVSPEDKELKDIRNAIKAMGGEVTSSLVVGYGNYYNKELLTDMAERFGGQIIHSSDLSTFPPFLSKFMEGARDRRRRILVSLETLPSKDGAVFSLTDGQVAVYPAEAGEIAFTPSKKGGDAIYTITDKKPKNGTEADSSDEIWIKASYAAALVLTQRTKMDQALEILSALGDVALVTAISNAFTNAEYGAAEQAITDAIGSKPKRFIAGKKVGCLPKRDAFCLLDAMRLLMADPDAQFEPYSDDFKYNRIGVPSKTKAGYPHFDPDKTTRVPLVDLTWNQTQLNLSVRCRIPGTVKLPKGWTDLGFKSNVYDTYVWRNYAVVKDGFLNTPVLPVSMSKSTYEKFLAEGVIDQEHNRHYQGRVYLLHLDRIPVINRAMADGLTSAKELCQKVAKELALQAEIKVLNALRDEIEPRAERSLGMSLTAEQEQFLKENGVTRNGFNPPTEKQDPTDFYTAKEFEIKAEGFSSLPKVEDVRKKLAAKKTLTASAQVMGKVLTKWDKSLPTFKKVEQLRQLDYQIGQVKERLAEVRSQIQETKFAVVLGKQWFDEFTSRDNNTLEVDGVTFTLSTREVRNDI
jgi:hypothetical protein